jgi:hypothetical protein
MESEIIKWAEETGFKRYTSFDPQEFTEEELKYFSNPRLNDGKFGWEVLTDIPDENGKSFNIHKDSSLLDDPKQDAPVDLSQHKYIKKIHKDKKTFVIL